MLIDCHHHLWDLTEVSYPWLQARGVRRFFGDPTPIQHDYLPENFRDDWGHISIGGSVHIQVGTAAGSEVAETRWLDRQAERTGLPSAIVAYADMTSADLEQVLDQHLAASERVRGVRHIVSRHMSEDANDSGAALLEHPNFASSLKMLEKRSLSFDLQLTPPYLPLAADVFDAVPDLRIALCHAGSPWEQDETSLQTWRSGLRAFAALPNTVCKLSGLGMFDPDWTPATLAPIVEGVLGAFGPERVMWGSNFPVDKLYRDYMRTFDVLWNLVPDSAREAVFGATAANFYRLELA